MTLKLTTICLSIFLLASQCIVFSATNLKSNLVLHTVIDDNDLLTGAKNKNNDLC